MLTRKTRFPVKSILLLGFWPSFIKRVLYRLRGYKIDSGVTIGFGSVVIGDEVTIGEGASLGFFSFVRGKDIKIGKRVAIGSATMIDTPHLIIGDDTRINEQVFIGGLQFPDSRLTIGKNCQIMQMTFINPAKWITIGDDTGIGGDSLLFGHTTWLSKFEGYPADFKPIEIGNSVSIAWRVFVSAGSKIGDGAVIGANSLVNRRIPSNCLATGSPAKVVAKAPYFPRNTTQEEKAEYLKEIISEMAQFLIGSELECEWDNDLQFLQVHRTTKTLFGKRRESWNLGIAYETQKNVSMPNPLHALVSLKELDNSQRDALETAGVLWLDIEKKERANLSNEIGEEAVQYLRRYGVRFSRPND